MTNYAPWNEPDHSHEHFFDYVEGPIYEDGAMIYIEECGYVEGEYGEGWSCDETNRIRLEESYIWIDGEGHPLSDDEDEWTRSMRFKVFDTEMAFERGKAALIEASPERVVIEHKDKTLIFQN